jgi:ADP-ribose pyrophosphatase YjhB (NUDIX family)
MVNYHVVAANLIEEDGEYLLVQEGKEAVHGQWNLPAGGVDQEDIKEAAKREAREETGLEVEPESFLGVFVDESDRSDATVLVFVFSAQPESFDFEVPESDEILDVKFLSGSEIESSEIRMPFTEEVIERYENGRTLPLEAVQDFRS